MKPEDVMEEFEIVTQRGIGDVFGYNTYLEIKDALEKQIPKEPIEAQLDYNCPICGWEYLTTERYCPECGQALKWGD